MHRPIRRLLAISTMLVLGCALWPTELFAQRARGRAVVRAARPVVVRTYVYRPFSPVHYYRPLYWRVGLGWGYGWYNPYPYPYWYQRYPYPRYQYRYPEGEASARLEVTPKDAQVFVDGYYVGIVDDFDGVFQRLDLRAGERTLEIYKEGYRTIRERMNFERGETYRVRFTMEPLAAGEAQPARPSPDPSAAPPATEPYGRSAPPRPAGVRGEGGAVAIRVQPEGATVLIDGERWDAPAGRDPLVVQLSEGSHRIEVQKEGYRPYALDIRIRRGETVPLNISLRPGT